jgi:beta-glucosidase
MNMKVKVFLLFMLFYVNLFPQNMLYKNPKIDIEVRVKDLLKRMTLEEKIAQMRSLHFVSFLENGEINENSIPIKTKNLSYGGIAGFTLTAKQLSDAVYVIQKYMVEKTRLGIPLLVNAEVLHGAVQDNCTTYPQAIAQGSTFNPELIGKMANEISKELKAMGVKQVLSPDLDLARELRWGRVEETFGEDPYLTGRMGVSYVKDFSENEIICTPKHFVAHGSPTGGLNLSSVAGGERELRSIYLKPFETVIKETHSYSIMNAYSSYDRVPIAGSKYFLTDILRKELGFKGYVYSDWGSIEMLKTFHHTAKDDADAAMQAVKAGLDFEISSDCFAKLDSLVKNKILDLKYIDNAVSNILRAKFAAGLFENPYPDRDNFENLVHRSEAKKLALEIAEESIVLLKNEKNILPLKTDIKSIAVIGPNANQVQFGDYSWTRDNKYGITPLQGIKNITGGKVLINYAKGCDIHTLDQSGFAEAIEAVNKSEVAVVFVGSQSASLAREFKNSTSGEGYDLSDLKLTGAQEELIKGIYKTHKPVIVVLVAGKPFAIPWIKENIPGIIVQWYGGEEAGNALASVLFGKINPSGKLNVSFPQSAGHLPVYYNYYPSDKGYYKNPGTYEKPGQDYVFSNPDALWPFGYGLSYTEFKYENISVNKERFNPNDTVNIKITLSNTGSRDGKEVVQLYVRDKVSSVVMPVKELKRFEKISLKANETKTVDFKLPIMELALYNSELKKVVEPGEFELLIGKSSSDIILKKTIEVGN